jgi:hypothetical protein
MKKHTVILTILFFMLCLPIVHAQNESGVYLSTDQTIWYCPHSGVNYQIVFLNNVSFYTNQTCSVDSYVELNFSLTLIWSSTNQTANQTIAHHVFYSHWIGVDYSNSNLTTVVPFVLVFNSTITGNYQLILEQQLNTTTWTILSTMNVQIIQESETMSEIITDIFFGTENFIGLLILLILIFVLLAVHKYGFLPAFLVSALLGIYYLQNYPALMWNGLILLIMCPVTLLAGLARISK